LASEQTAASRRGLLATRGRKIAAAIGAAFLATIGAGIGARVLNNAESVTRKALSGSRAPIQVRVMAHGTFLASGPIGQYYVVPKSEVSSPTDLDPAELPSLDNPFNFAFAQRHNAVEGSPQAVSLHLRARGDEPVTINAIKVHVVGRTAPVKGWYAVSGGCGEMAVRTALVDLDSPNPEAHFLDELGAPNKRITLFVTRTDIEQIELQASTRKAMVDWTAEVFYSGPDGDGSIAVDDHGQPFRVTTETASDGYSLAFSTAPSEEGRPEFEREHRWDGTGISMC
jgi:hypothetical protein